MIIATPKQTISNIFKEKFSTASGIQFISAKSHIAIEELKNTLYRSCIDEKSLRSEDTILTNARHYEALQKVNESLTDIHLGLDNSITGDLLTPDIRRCLHYISEITGEITNEDILDFIFSLGRQS